MMIVLFISTGWETEAREKGSPHTELRMQGQGHWAVRKQKHWLLICCLGSKRKKKGTPFRVSQILVWGGEERPQMRVPSPLLKLQQCLVVVLAGSQGL